jgi:hypothetical protein
MIVSLAFHGTFQGMITIQILRAGVPSSPAAKQHIHDLGELERFM